MIFANITKNNILVLWIAIQIKSCNDFIKGFLIMEKVFNILIVYSIIVAILLLGVLLEIFFNKIENHYSDILARRGIQKKCPKCHSILYDRIHRKSWMRLIPGTKLYYCYSCMRKFMIFFHRNALKMAYKKS